MKTDNPILTAPVEQSDMREEWFDQLIHLITTDKMLVQGKIATAEKQQFYDKIIFGDPLEALGKMRSKTSEVFVTNLVLEYSELVKSTDIKPHKLFITHNDSEVLIWAEIANDDEKTEIGLFKIEAKVNAKYYQHGFTISSTIVEQSDNIPAPPHYKDLTSLTLA